MTFTEKGRPDWVDPDDTSTSFQEWCEANGYDPVSRTYTRPRPNQELEED